MATNYNPLVFKVNEMRVSRAKNAGKLKEYIRNASNGFIKRREVREEVFKRDNYKCTYCGNTKDLQIDHIVSVYRIGLEANSLENLQTLCNSCNAAKRV